MWPKDVKARAVARAISCEMHSGFFAMRTVMSHNLQLKQKTFTATSANEDIERIKNIWLECLNHSGGPFLFGSFTIADGIYAPVVNRFVSYAVPVSSPIESYMKKVRDLEASKLWFEGAMKEPEASPDHK